MRMVPLEPPVPVRYVPVSDGGVEVIVESACVCVNAPPVAPYVALGFA